MNSSKNNRSTTNNLNKFLTNDNSSQFSSSQSINIKLSQLDNQLFKKTYRSYGTPFQTIYFGCLKLRNGKIERRFSIAPSFSWG